MIFFLIPEPSFRASTYHCAVMCTETASQVVAADGNGGITTFAHANEPATQTTGNTKRVKDKPYVPPTWLQRQFLATRDLMRIEASYQRHSLEKLHNRQPRLVGHIMLRLLNSLNRVPWFFFNNTRFIVDVTTKFSIQLFDLAIVSLFRGIYDLPYAVTLMFVFVGILPSIPYAYWTIEDVQKTTIASIAYAVWVLWMTHLYVHVPQRWAGWGKWFTFENIMFGPYVPLIGAAAIFANHEHQPITNLFFILPT